MVSTRTDPVPTAVPDAAGRPHEGRTAVVTGGATGIGRALARRLAAGGASVAVLDIADASAVLTDLAEHPAPSTSVLVDLCDGAAVQSAAAEVTARLGAPDIVVNSAGIYPTIPFADLTHDRWRTIFAINVDAAFHTAKAFTPAMCKRGWGRVVSVASNATSLVIPGFSAYTASKLALVGFTRGLATDLAPHGVTVNAVSPSLTRTATMVEISGHHADVVPQLQAIKRLQEPEDLAGTVSFLVSDDAAFLTGQNIMIDGGLVRS